LNQTINQFHLFSVVHRARDKAAFLKRSIASFCSLAHTSSIALVANKSHPPLVFPQRIYIAMGISASRRSVDITSKSKKGSEETEAVVPAEIKKESSPVKEAVNGNSHPTEKEKGEVSVNHGETNLNETEVRIHASIALLNIITDALTSELDQSRR
jgi:hypothetical protein